eukprot:gene9063-6361_t
MESNIRVLLVFVPFYDNVPHRMKLRFRAGMTVDELMGQIQRQLEAESAKEVKYPLVSSQYVAMLFDPRDNALVPFERSSLELQTSCSKVLLHRRPITEPVVGKPSAETTDVGVGRTCNTSGELAPVPQIVSSTAQSVERERLQRSTSTMLHIVGMVVSELALQTSSDCALTEKTWPDMVAWALDKEDVAPDALDPTVVDQFKRTLLTALSRGQKNRGDAHDS